MKTLPEAFGPEVWRTLCKALLGLLAVFGAINFLFPVGKAFASTLINIIKLVGVDPAQPWLLIVITSLTLVFLILISLGLVCALWLQTREDNE